MLASYQADCERWNNHRRANASACCSAHSCIVSSCRHLLVLDRVSFELAENTALGPFQKGPILSKWSHAVVAGLCFTAPIALVSDSFGLPIWLKTVLNLLAGLVSALMIGGMIYDFAASRVRRRA